MYKETVPFVSGGSHFHFTKKRFLFVLQNDEGAYPLVIYDDFWDSPSLYGGEGSIEMSI
ncbi:hypothetical protein D3C85_1320090 [compost metagenome]